MTSFRVCGVGRLTKDPQLSKTNSGYSVLNCTLAANGYRAKKEVTDWIKCEIWAHDAEFLATYAKKGDPVYVDGILATVSYKDKNGYDRQDTKVIAQNIELLAGKKAKEEPAKDQSKFYASDLDRIEIKPDDLPF